MEVFTVNGIIHPVLYPKSLFCPLAFRTMTVTTAVITYPLFTTAIAIINMTSQSRSTAFLKGIQGAHNITIWVTPLNILLSKPINDLSNFKLRPEHYL
jgi:hypothetical protein